MAEFQKVVKERKRMCSCFASCVHCPLAEVHKGMCICRDWTFNNPKEAERIIMQWSEEHPIMTNRRKFEEVFGKDLFKLCVEEPWGDVLKWLDEEYQEAK